MVDRRVRYLVISIAFHGGLVEKFRVSSKGPDMESESRYLVSKARPA